MHIGQGEYLELTGESLGGFIWGPISSKFATVKCKYALWEEIIWLFRFLFFVLFLPGDIT